MMLCALSLLTILCPVISASGGIKSWINLTRDRRDRGIPEEFLRADLPYTKIRSIKEATAFLKAHVDLAPGSKKYDDQFNSRADIAEDIKTLRKILCDEMYGNKIEDKSTSIQERLFRKLAMHVSECQKLNWKFENIPAIKIAEGIRRKMRNLQTLVNKVMNETWDQGEVSEKIVNALLANDPEFKTCWENRDHIGKHGQGPRAVILVEEADEVREWDECTIYGGLYEANKLITSVQVKEIDNDEHVINLPVATKNIRILEKHQWIGIDFRKMLPEMFKKSLLKGDKVKMMLAALSSNPSPKVHKLPHNTILPSNQSPNERLSEKTPEGTHSPSYLVRILVGPHKGKTASVRVDNGGSVLVELPDGYCQWFAKGLLELAEPLHKSGKWHWKKSA